MGSEMIPDLDEDAGRHLDHPGSVRLRVSLEKVAPVLGQALLDRDAPKVIEVLRRRAAASPGRRPP